MPGSTVIYDITLDATDSHLQITALLNPTSWSSFLTTNKFHRNRYIAQTATSNQNTPPEMNHVLSKENKARSQDTDFIYGFELGLFTNIMKLVKLLSSKNKK